MAVKLFPLKIVISNEQLKEESVLKMKMHESISQPAQLFQKQNKKETMCKPVRNTHT